MGRLPGRRFCMLLALVLLIIVPYLRDNQQESLRKGTKYLQVVRIILCPATSMNKVGIYRFVADSAPSVMNLVFGSN